MNSWNIAGEHVLIVLFALYADFFQVQIECTVPV